MKSSKSFSMNSLMITQMYFTLRKTMHHCPEIRRLMFCILRRWVTIIKCFIKFYLLKDFQKWKIIHLSLFIFCPEIFSVLTTKVSQDELNTNVLIEMTFSTLDRSIWHQIDINLYSKLNRRLNDILRHTSYHKTIIAKLYYNQANAFTVTKQLYPLTLNKDS